MASAQSRVLVVEDDAIISDLLITQFKNNNIDCLAVGSGEDALDLLKTNADFSVILLDISLPGMDGFEVLSNLKKDPHTAGIPVIITSNFAMEKDISWAKELGAAQFISKVATTPSEIVNAIEAYSKAQPAP